MEDAKYKPTHFALLIGVNADNERPLKGCVRDAREISKYINSSLPSVHVQLFTADTTALQSEIPEAPATYANIKSGFHSILSIAAPDTYVYIHYSGHGVRMEASGDFSNRTTGDLALNVLQDPNQTTTRPFPGIELAKVLHEMVTNGLTVTVVLDCCFSGSLLRHDSASATSSVRYREYSKALYDQQLPIIRETEVMNFGEAKGSTDGNDRDASMLPNWLVNPEGYTVITACGPHEIAEELDLGGPAADQTHGALSYFLLRVMRKLGGLGGKHAHIYPYLCSMFRQYRPTQNPMWYGNKDLYFFGNTTLSTDLTGAPFATNWRDARLRLQGGQAHGLSEGDQFAIYTIDSTRPLVTGAIENVGPLSSDIDIADPTLIPRKGGCIAKALTHLSLRDYPIRLVSGCLDAQDWPTALEERKYLSFEEDRLHPFVFDVYANSNGDGYQIRDKFGHETNCSQKELHSDSRELDLSHVLNILERLAKFHLVQNLANRSGDNPFGGLYKVALRDPAGQEHLPGSKIAVHGKKRLYLVVENHGIFDLYIHVYNLSPLGEVRNILKASYAVISPENRREGFMGQWVQKLQTKVPQQFLNQGIISCKDVIKIFITSQPTSFAPLEMQKLDDLHDNGIIEPERGDGFCTEREDWTALNFTIFTHRKHV
ncbi:hypothetical protein F4808DRAFT_475171 [Astrocystis sublimbata]|nr:hypothetical protein F4808DRAFT_475171 [Astrocystis sublimbata]